MKNFLLLFLNKRFLDAKLFPPISGENNCKFDHTGPGLNSRPGLYFLKYTINPRPLNGTGFYSEEASIRGNMALQRVSNVCVFQITHV